MYRMFTCLTCNAPCRREFCHKHHPESKAKHHEQIKKYRQTEKGQIATKKYYQNKKLKKVIEQVKQIATN